MENASASDIITYVGVPLAVLGVLPILYNTFATLASLSRIKRMLKRGRLTALTRSDVVNRVIEIELPRYAVKPWDRLRQRDEYWSLSEHPSSIPGGSWTTFNWKTNTIGSKTQRVEYADQVRQPQADIAFDELICYLLDLGAVPDPQGWKLLRSSGLWTPAGCPLLLSPDSRHKALVVGPQDDADGNLSLVVSWANSWTTRDHPQLPPYWVRLPGKSYDAKAKNGAGETKAPMTSEERNAQEEDQPAPAESDITCQILTTGITAAYCAQGKDGASEELPIDHLQISPIASSGVWFASAATAFGTTSQTILWNYQIPDELLRFARRETVPCGVLVLLGFVDETQTPSWATSYNDSLAQHEQFARRSREMQLVRQEEGRMAPDQRRIAEQNRMRREGEQRLQDLRDRQRESQQRIDQRMIEALQSPMWTAGFVAEHALRWLRAQNEGHGFDDGKELVGQLLHEMLRDRKSASKLCGMLDAWKAWADIGGMKKTDYEFIQADRSTFARATLLVALIVDVSTASETTLAVDLQQCLNLWKQVRLG